MNLCSTLPTPGDGFAVVDDGATWRYSGALTFDNATAIYAASEALPLPTSGRIDLAAVTHLDSSALAVMLAVMRRARAAGIELTLAHVPPASVTLAHVYGIAELFRLAPGDKPA
ncbi:MAG: STAS domain-containing protein [Proteobacteria bacterium]|nr:STAS domain-containing protein [Pseudomonadota bacterium]